MAHKSKSQRAKATAAKANRREREERDAIARENADSTEEAASEEKKSGLFKSQKSETKQESSTKVEKAEKKPKKERFKFLKDVRSEMKRVTWPTRQDVIRWSGVVVAALLFFGIYVAVLDNAIISPGLIALSTLGG